MKRALIALVLASCSDPGGSKDAGGDQGPVEPVVAVDGIGITQIAHFQGTKIPIMTDGDLPTAPKRAYAVAGKPSLFRVYVKHDAAWRTRALNAILDITAGGMTTTLMTSVPDVTTSTDDSLASTVNFDLPVELMTADAVYAVRIVEVGKMARHSVDSLPARWPTDGTTTTLDAHSSGAQLKLTLVPIRYNADGSGRLPYTNQVQIDDYKNLLYDNYPTPAIEITMHAIVNWSLAVLANGMGWGNLLGFIANLRQSEKAPADVYYYGLFEPAATLQAYCGMGCVEGLALEGTMPTDTFSRAAIGVGYPDPSSATTMLQELAHNMGRLHANCGGPGALDPAFPYPMGGIGVWGWSLTTQTLYPPDKNKDFMSYCQPVWTSDYTYRGLFDRIQLVNNAAIVPAPNHDVRLAPWDGKSPRTPGGFIPFDNLPGGLVIVSE